MSSGDRKLRRGARRRARRGGGGLEKFELGVLNRPLCIAGVAQVHARRGHRSRRSGRGRRRGRGRGCGRGRSRGSLQLCCERPQVWDEIQPSCSDIHIGQRRMMYNVRRPPGNKRFANDGWMVRCTSELLQGYESERRMVSLCESDKLQQIADSRSRSRCRQLPKLERVHKGTRAN